MYKSLLHSHYDDWVACRVGVRVGGSGSVGVGSSDASDVFYDHRIKPIAAPCPSIYYLKRFVSVFFLLFWGWRCKRWHTDYELTLN